MMSSPYQLYRDALGRLVFVSADGQTYEGVTFVRAFPISEPDHGLSLVDMDGHERLWVDQLTDLTEAVRAIVEEELASREFMPEINALQRVSSYTTPSVWHVQTDRGATAFTLRGEEDIRRLSGQTLLIADSHGIFYLIRDLQRLDKRSRKLLDHFL